MTRQKEEDRVKLARYHLITSPHTSRLSHLANLPPPSSTMVREVTSNEPTWDSDIIPIEVSGGPPSDLEVFFSASPPDEHLQRDYLVTWRSFPEECLKIIAVEYGFQPYSFYTHQIKQWITSAQATSPYLLYIF